MVWHRFRPLMLLCFLLLILPPLSPAVLATWRICPPNSTYCIERPIADVWAAYGAVPVFGYPISQASATVQWFERARIEHHPEHTGTPYEFLLGSLGRERLAQLGRTPSARERGPQAGCLWFEETGYNVCDQTPGLGFKTYWEAHGLAVPGLDRYASSLQLFGLPLTTPQLETNAAGDTVLTQWFERARFEWHPSNPDTSKVLLGLLGYELRGAPAPAPVPPAPQPTRPPTATPIPAPTATPAPPPPSYNNCQADPNAASAPNWPIAIRSLIKDGSPETVSLANVSQNAVNLNGWRICSIRGNQLHATLSGTLQPGQTLIVPSQAGGPIWNDATNDPAALYDDQGRLISYWAD